MLDQKKTKEIVLYLFFGGIAFFLNIGLFLLFNKVLGITELIANVFCWILCVLFQFFTNRTWVFEGKTETAVDFWKQMFSFFGGRLFTLLVEEVILAVFVTWLQWDSMIVKLAAQVIVIVLNYLISKLFVFKKEDTGGNDLSRFDEI
jgi:putative flippase GtrA